MKLNISKLQSGGGMPFVAYSYQQYPISTGQDTQQLAEPEKSSGVIDFSKLFSSSTLKLLIENGLPNEVNLFFKKVKQIEAEAQFNKNINRDDIYDLANLSSQIIFNKKQYELAQEDVIKNEAMDEWAGEGNYIFVRDNKNNKIKQISLSQYVDKKDRYTPIKNKELLRAKAYDENFAFNSYITSVLKNTIGSHIIEKNINEVVKAMGSKTMSSEDILSLLEAKQLLVAKKQPSQQAMEGLQELFTALDKLGPDALFKIKEQQKDSNIDAAFKYLWSILSNNAKDTLTRKAVVANEKEMTPQNVIMNAIQTYRDQEYSLGIDIDSSTTAKSKASSEKTRSLKPHEQLINGDIGRTSLPIISKKVPSVSFTVQGTEVGHLYDKSGNSVPAAPLELALSMSDTIGYIDQSHIYFGNTKLSKGLLNHVIYNGENIIRAWLPVDARGNINFELAVKYDNVMKEIDNMPNATLTEKNNLLKKVGIDGHFDQNGEFVGGYTMAEFLITTGETTENVIDPELNIYASDEFETDKERKLELARLKGIYAFFNKGRKGDAKFDLDLNFFSGTTDVVRAPIFMKISNTAHYDASVNSNAGFGVVTPTLEQVMAQEIPVTKLQGVGSDLLYANE